MTNLFGIGVPRLRIEILIVVRNYGFVDHVKVIPASSQLLRVPFRPSGRSVLVDYPDGA